MLGEPLRLERTFYIHHHIGKSQSSRRFLGGDTSNKRSGCEFVWFGKVHVENGKSWKPFK